MEESSLVTANKAHRKGLWQVRIWPMFVVLLVFGGLIYGIIQYALPIDISLIGFTAVVLLCFIWSLRRIGTWKSWMAANTVNPKTAMEMANASFLKHKWKENLAIWGKSSKLKFRTDFDERMAEVKKAYMKDAEDRYAHKKPVSVHYRFAGLLWMLMFEVIVLTGLILLFMYQDDAMVKIIAGVVFVLGLGGMFYTLKTIWKRNQTILEISIHGITIQGKHYGWIELENVDIVKDDTLVYQKHKGPEQIVELNNLSLSGDYLDELILFYRTAQQAKTDN
jgi:hypothetical protein